jgi:GNAT superfamily N-acetyltransferase
MTGGAIRLARPGEIDALIAIDDDACTLDAEAGLVMVFDASHPFVVDERARWTAAIAGGFLDVAETSDGTLVGLAARRVVDGEPYLDQLSVRRTWMRRGIGTELLRRAIAWASDQPGGRLWLTTWRHVPWNAPFYARHGFAVCSDGACGPELRAVLGRQREVLPAPDQRTAMVRACAADLAPKG